MTRYLAIALALLATSPAFAAERTLDRTFTASPGDTLVVNSDSASVRVSGGDTNQVTVRMSIRSSSEDLAGAYLDAVQKDGVVTVTLRYRGDKSWFRWGSWNGDGHIQVTVPKRHEIRIQTSGGDVDLADIAGSATLRTSGGEIDARNVTGSIDARTSGGGIRADTIRGDVDASTSGGSIRLLQVDGKIRGRTSGGSVDCSLVGINRGISASTSGGSIQLTLPRTTTANIEATTSGGQFTTDIPVAATRWEDGHVKGSLNGGGETIDIHTSGGGITLRAAN